MTAFSISWKIPKQQLKSFLVALFLIIGWDSELLICPRRSVRPREVAQDGIRVVP